MVLCECIDQKKYNKEAGLGISGQHISLLIPYL